MTTTVSLSHVRNKKKGRKKKRKKKDMSASQFRDQIARKWREAEERTNALIVSRRNEKMRKDEELARKIQNEEFGKTSSAPILPSVQYPIRRPTSNTPTYPFRRTDTTTNTTTNITDLAPPRLDIGCETGNHSWKLVPAIKGAAFCAACPKLEMIPKSLENTYLIQSTQFRVWPPKGLWIRGKSESYEVWCACERVPSAAFRSSYNSTDDVVVTSEGRVYKLFKRQTSATVGRKLIFPSDAGRILVFVRGISRSTTRSSSGSRQHLYPTRTSTRRPFYHGSNTTADSLLEAADRQMDSFNRMLSGLGGNRRGRWQ
jgi:hypothetical protein